MTHKVEPSRLPENDRKLGSDFWIACLTITLIWSGFLILAGSVMLGWR